MEMGIVRSNQSLLCRACRTALGTSRPLLVQTHPQAQTNAIRERQRLFNCIRYASNRASAQVLGNQNARSKKAQDQARNTKQPSAIAVELDVAKASASAILNHPSIPTESENEAALNEIESITRELVHAQQQNSPPELVKGKTPASALLSLDSSSSEARAPPPAAKLDNEAISLLSTLAFDIVTHPPVFLSPTLLSTYVSIQSLLQRPATLPEVFVLYTDKPQPSLRNKSDPTSLTYTAPSPTAVAAAIPTDTANAALLAAIAGPARSLPLALNIINAAFRAPAFRRAKLFRRALPPFAAAALAPVAAATAASQLAAHQTALPADSFAGIAFAGMLTYAAAVGTIGYVALTTANDQMRRVTWAVGMPLWERWLREEERAAVDAVALAFGFREQERWGEEEGKDWEELKEWAGYRGMILDKVSLMEGMQ